MPQAVEMYMLAAMTPQYQKALRGYPGDAEWNLEEYAVFSCQKTLRGSMDLIVTLRLVTTTLTPPLEKEKLSEPLSVDKREC